jgi:hypothetical protein
LTLKLAVETPALVLMAPLPLTPATAVVHVLFEYNVKLTDPVGAAFVVPAKVAVSLTGVIATPAVPVVGLVWVVIVGAALPTTICSLPSPQPVVKPTLFASPM